MPPKIHRVNGSLLGFSGIREEGNIFLEWFRGECREKRPELKEFTALQVTPDGQLVLWDNLCVPMPLSPDVSWWATGSGREPAIGAMAAGATPMRAMEIACEYDMNSRPPIISLSLALNEAQVVPITTADESRKGAAGIK
jgi:hypothetical protein